MFAPGNKPDVLRKLPRSEPDVAVLDLEDAVPNDQKVQARLCTAEVGAELAPLVATYVRVNAVPSSHFALDFAGVPNSAAGVAVPKVETIDQLDEVAAQLDAHGLSGLDVMAGIETAAGVARSQELLGHPRVASVYFGAEDFIADMGGVRSAENTEVLFARSAVVLAARVHGVASIDQIVADFGDDDRFRREAQTAKGLGFVGKLCIHPRQVALANTAFTATEAEIAHAHRLVAAYDAAVAEGSASIAFDGQMIDEALVRRSRAIVARHPKA